MERARPTLRWFSISLLLSVVATAQVLPPHPPLRILIVSDEVNPHGLPPDQLTQPGELATALLAVPALRLDDAANAVHEVPTDQIEQATALLELPQIDPLAYDVLIYFAHRIPNGADAQARQEAFVTAVDGHLDRGGGVVSFHHGIYRTAGKDSMQNLLGAEATGAVVWNTVDGQNVIAVEPGHFVAYYGVTYPTTTVYQDPTLGIPLASYPLFNNTPDERYPSFDLLPTTGEVDVLFATDFDGGTHLLGYTKRRADWSGVVVTYQPGEHQPSALTAGNNLQILLNAVVYAARHADGALLFGDTFATEDTSLWSSTVGNR